MLNIPEAFYSFTIFCTWVKKILNMRFSANRHLGKFVIIICHYAKLPLPNARLLFKNNYAIAIIFLNTIIQRLPTPKKAIILVSYLCFL